MQIEPEEALEREVAFAHAVVGAMQVAVERQHERHRVLRDRVGGEYAGTRTHRQPRRGGRSVVYVVVSGAAQRHEPRTPARKRVDGGAVKLVVHEDAHGGKTTGERRSRRGESLPVVDEFVPRRLVGGVQIEAVIRPGAEDGDAHNMLPVAISDWPGERSVILRSAQPPLEGRDVRQVYIGVVVQIRRVAAGRGWQSRAAEARQQRGRIGDVYHPVAV